MKTIIELSIIRISCSILILLIKTVRCNIRSL